MIVSASRRTDLPRFYFDWFLNRLQAGFALVRNPRNPHAVSRVPLGEEVVDCLVFWTKDPAPMLGRLSALAPYPFYIQFTLNAYGPDIEPGLPAVEERLSTFWQLSRRLSPQQVVWRYSPVVLGGGHTVRTHAEAFERLARALAGHTLQCRLSFLEPYRKIRLALAQRGLRDATGPEKAKLCALFSRIAAAHGIELSVCGNVDAHTVGLPQAHCIDAELVGRLLGEGIRVPKDPGQPPGCFCAQSVDIGAYDSCPAGCVYCYANGPQSRAAAAFGRHDPQGELMLGTLLPGDVVTERKVRRLREGQLRFY